MRLNPIRLLFPKFYIRLGKEIDKRKYERQYKAAKSPEEQNELRDEYYQCTYREWDEWLTSIEDRELIKRAQKVDVYLDDIPYTTYDKDDVHSIMNSHYYLGMFCTELLDHTVKKQLTEAYRKRLPEYRKERREVVELYIKGGGVLIGIIGALAGFFAVYSKCG